jgi:hypothetical protein
MIQSSQSSQCHPKMMMQKPPSEYWTNLQRRFLGYAPAKLGLENPTAVVKLVDKLGV